MSRQQTSPEFCERMMEGWELQHATYKWSLLKNAFSQLILGSLLFGMALVLWMKILTENSGYPLLYSGIITSILGTMTLSSGGAALLATRRVWSPSLSSLVKALILVHVSLSVVSIPSTLAAVAFTAKPMVDCLRAVEGCFPDPVKKGAWSLAIMVLLLLLFLLNLHACSLLGSHGDSLGFSPRQIRLCRALRFSARGAEISETQPQEDNDNEWQDDKKWQPPPYEEAIHMCNEGGRDILPAGVHSSCQASDEEEPPKYEDIALIGDGEK